MPPLNTILFELFQAHGVKAVLRDDDVFFPESGRKVSAAIINETPQANGMSVRMDVRFTIASGLTIAEAFVGIGEDKENAIGSAIQSFAANSLHVFLAAFFQTSQEQVTEEEWIIGSKKRSVTIGNVGIRGKKPVQGTALLEWFPYFEKVIGQHTLGPEPHWIRLYYAHSQGKLVVCEVLLDNEVWEEVQTEMSAFSWPSGEDFYSLRIFLVIAGDESVITPKRSVAILAETVEASPDTTDEEIYAALADAGVPEAAAHRAFFLLRSPGDAFC